MLTVEDILKNKLTKPFGGFSFRDSFGRIDLSVVGGGNGLYGDFVDTFEVALIDNKTKRFVTRNLFGGDDDVLAYQTKEELENILLFLQRDPSLKTGVVDADKNQSVPKVNES